MSPDWGHDIPNLTAGLLHHSVRTLSLGHGDNRVPNMAEYRIVSIDQTLKEQGPSVSEVAVLTPPEFNPITTENDHRPISLRSSSTQTSLSSSQSRRDSGYSSSKQTTTKSRRGSRTSSKQSLPSTQDTSASHEGSVRPARPRLSSISRTQSSKLSVEDALALHERSKKLFPGPSQPQLPVLGPQEAPIPVLHRAATSPHSYPRPPSRRVHITRTQTFNALPRNTGLRALNDLSFGQPENPQAEQKEVEEEEEEEEEASIPPPVTMHWTSDETRRREYAHIDKQARGIRGAWNKIIPRFMRRASSKFYDGDEGSDAGSVRRFRLDLPAR